MAPSIHTVVATMHLGPIAEEGVEFSPHNYEVVNDRSKLWSYVWLSDHMRGITTDH